MEVFSEEDGGFDNKGESPFQEDDDGSHLGEGCGSLSIKDSGFVEDRRIFLGCAVDSLRGGTVLL